MNDTPAFSIDAFLRDTGERDQPGEKFELESPKMLEVTLDGRVWTKLGAMVAYRGDVRFKREGMLEGGLGKALMKAITSEMSVLSKAEGKGKVYLADGGKEVTVLRLEGDSINISGNDLLAFEDSVQYEITMHRRVAGMMSGGLFSARLHGRGMVALTTHGRPLTLTVRPGDPVFTDPNATVAWSAGLSPELKSDITFKALMGRGGGETFQMKFEGSGFVVVQPYEEVPVVTSSGG